MTEDEIEEMEDELTKLNDKRFNHYVARSCSWSDEEEERASYLHQQLYG